MQEHLYFITDICNALKDIHSEQKTEKVIMEIINKGKKPEYQQGFRQFVTFIKKGKAGWLKMLPQHKKLIMQIINDVAMSPVVDTETEPLKLRLQLEHDGDTLASFDISESQHSYTIADLNPGNYTLKTDSDWLIWQEHLSERELFWTHAYPDQEFPMTADTESYDSREFKAVVLLEGEVVIRIYPGLETGIIKIMVNSHAGK